jgi:hypothetical protein
VSESVFNPDTFLGTVTDQAGDTTYTPPPAKEYPHAQIIKVDGRQITSKKAATFGQTYTMIEVTWELIDDEAKKATGMDHPTARQSLFVDTLASGALDFSKNKNVQLGRLRDAVGQNKNGKKWAPAHLLGQNARVMVKHETNDETGEVRGVVSRVAAA